MLNGATRRGPMKATPVMRSTTEAAAENGEASSIPTPRRSKSVLRRWVATVMAPFGLPVEYVPEDCYDHVRNYKYCGQDLSPVYQYALKPLAQACISITPPTIAPNVITLAGFACTFFAVVVGICISDPMFTEPIPSWYAALTGFCILAYQTLDNMDGIQARKTGNSSPLGQLFDHGIDAMNATLFIMLMGINTGNGPMRIYITLVVTMATFFSTTWEEYATGSFTLGYVNGPDDGLLGCSVMLLLSAYIGPHEFWDYEVPGVGQEIKHILVPCLGIAAACTVGLQLITTYRSNRDGFFKSLPALGQLMLYLVLYLVAATRQAWAHGNPVVLCTAGGTIFGLMMCRLILAHVCHKEVSILQREHLLLLPAVVFPVYGTMVSAIAGLVATAHYAVVAIDDFCVALNINAFSI